MIENMDKFWSVIRSISHIDKNEKDIIGREASATFQMQNWPPKPKVPQKMQRIQLFTFLCGCQEDCNGVILCERE